MRRKGSLVNATAAQLYLKGLIRFSEMIAVPLQKPSREVRP
ncbi:hypothetical protein BAJUN_00970 [Bajunvirus bajun]|uniref:Uncharacterized protein n=1 Tax=Brevundimonas phage vB_BgoS-Bajun TaxID=2948594 RepID=A0A9E7N771_9CAUD|nr:hypothetical protein BAJUN_00970 [Brevundimonas phage vB_BgoS-Bajun]